MDKQTAIALKQIMEKLKEIDSHLEQVFFKVKDIQEEIQNKM